MQPIIEAYPKATFVLLHGSYPYTHDAGYLASVYQNVYAGFGEVFPVISRHGRCSVVKQLLEATSANCEFAKSDYEFDSDAVAHASNR